jgi:hypothetical protein
MHRAPRVQSPTKLQASHDDYYSRSYSSLRMHKEMLDDNVSLCVNRQGEAYQLA